jgi:hypothetical protein
MLRGVHALSITYVQSRKAPQKECNAGIDVSCLMAPRIVLNAKSGILGLVFCFFKFKIAGKLKQSFYTLGE